MYAIVQKGGQQIQVEKGQILKFDKMDGAEGDVISFDEVLLVVDGETRKVGTPVVKGATVSGRIVTNVKGKKVIAFQFRRRKASKRKKGHRQQYTQVEITDITY